jgi:hypothetical protein
VKHEVNVRHDQTASLEMTEKVLARIEALANRAGVAVPALPAPIEGDFKVVSETP